MSYISSILGGLMAVIDGLTADVLTATVAEIEASAGKDARKSS